jgi:formylglycine-generating enzyme required for sulfatase activity
LSSTTGKTYRLPTEAEWEYAAKANSSYKYAGSNDLDAVAWHGGNSGSKPHPVGQKQANGLGLYDMSGNVWEWCSDWYKGYPGSSGVSDYTGSYRVNRGGSWNDNAVYCRPANRSNNTPANRGNGLGFRVCLTHQ